MCFTKCVRKVKRNFTRVKCGDQGSKVCDMWMCPTSPFQVSLIMFVVLMISSWSPIICSSSSSGGASDSVGKSFSKRARAKRAAGVIKIEVIAILADSTNASLSLSKALVRALNAPLHSSDSDEHVELSSPSKNFTFRVKNFVITNYSGGVESKTGSEGFTEEYESSNSNANQRKGLRKHSHQTLKPHVNVPFFPGIILDMCDFLRKTKAVAMVNTISDVASERLLSLVSSATTLPLIGSSQFADPLQTLYKSSDDFYINLSISVRHFARALGHFLIYCHWHTFTVLIDDSPSILSSQMIWEEELNLMQTSYRFHHRSSRNLSSSFFDYDEHKKSGDLSAMYEEEGGNDDDAETSPVLNPHFITLKTNNSNSAFRALSSVTKATQGVVVLLCSERSLRRIFESANQLGMLNGNYIFILVGQRSQFEVIPEWVPNGVLALRSPQKGGIGKQTMKRAGKLLSSAFHSVKNLRLLTSGAQQVGRGRTSDPNFITSIKTSTNVGSAGSSTHASSTPVFPATLKSSNPGNLHHPKEKSKPKIQDVFNALSNVTCWKTPVSFLKKSISEALTREMQKQMDVIQSLPMAQITEGRKDSSEELQTTFDVLNLIRSESNREWRTVGNVCVEAARVQLETIRWPAGGIFGPSVRVGANKAYRIVTITSPPFVMVAEADDNETCVKGLSCLKVETIDKDELALIFAEFDRGKHIGPSYRLACCDGLAMDLLASISRELKFEVDLFLVPDGYFGSRSGAGHWNGIMSALLSGSAHMSFAPISVTSIRANSVDFSTPFFFSGVSLLGMSKTQDVSLMAFLAPFSFELWAAIFITLNMTALAVALFEWLSPFGLNPWGRQRTKNFSMASALWVVWGRLFSHLVAFKAPKSWPNKFLINVWGGFSVIFVASYTANIAALFAGRFFERALGVHDRSLLSQRVAAVKHSATDFYIKREHLQLWEHIQKFPVFSFQQGVELLKNGSLDLLIGDGPLLDYYRGSDSSCSLIDVSDHDKIGDDTYAVAMTKGFPLKESISSLVAKYIGNGYMDYLQGKWYGQLLCFRRRRSEFAGAKALEVDAVYGMMIMLGIGTLVGLLILSMELIVYKYALPYFRKQPKGTLWRSPNIMFFSQKLYRFINSVELVSPHHAAKELVNTLRHGQITSLFQKSVKRKEHEQRRRRKSKAQFFEMIQEVRRVQKRERQESVQHVVDSHENERDLASPIYSIQARLESNKQTPKLIRVLGVDVDMPNKTFLTMPSRSSSIIETSGEGEGTDVVNQQPLSPPSGYTDSDNKHRQTTSKGRRKTTKILKRKPTESARKLKSVEFDLGGLADEDEELQVETRLDYSPESNGESECFSSPLDQTDLSGLSKAQVIQLWRDSESNLRRQLNDTLREREELTLKLDAITSEKPP